MRLKLTLQVLKPYNALPLNYFYYLSAWIYSVISISDKAYAKVLHDTGYRLLHKKFKLFSFSKLMPDFYRIDRRNGIMFLNGEKVEIIINFWVEKAVEKFIIGLFQKQEFYIGHPEKCRLSVDMVERLPLPEFQETMHYCCLSPICVSFQPEGKKYADYLSPHDPQYDRILLDNLINKYRLIENLSESTEAVRERVISEWGFRFCCETEELRSWLQTIRKGKPDETRVRGYEYPFSLTTSPTLHKIGYLTGFGEKNAMGFGCVEAGEPER